MSAKGGGGGAAGGSILAWEMGIEGADVTRADT